MKLIRNTVLFAGIAVVANACKLDNYIAPNASIHGSIVDATTKELIQQDIVDGSKIIYVEQGFQNPEEQNMAIKTDGNYENALVFSGSYNIYFNESNFVRPDTLRSHAINKGENKLDFEVQPYIRVTDASIEKVDNKIVATFTVTPTVTNKVREIGVFAHIDYVVGNRFKLVETKHSIDTPLGEPTVYTLEIDLSSGSGSQLKAGEQYYFRVGALIDAPGAKYNYAPAKRITM